ncbi:hypothetical protein [Mycobacterium paragordonae]|uniref:Uncharacterized protein n=1 Tax=Mycobacterium paragordonae TaxID=1389713 RepID=A0AAJ1S8P3_9MYCO|nr:hypothetical protein [Mycobacterium paragordonae]MBI2699694.1 hypothetical protein [Mycobacterium sp.]MDP7739260.1 hypothetical protein [Mycobacterium paragordonae]TDK94670.1 hypothetical protein EI067_18700 [Mycobacterium paragordonae]TDL04040.1 hypothetical protein EUA05_22560 [Mycobacterium paragordonae]
MNIWDQLAHQAHTLLTRPRRTDLTPAVTLVQSLHPHNPHTPAAICAHLDTATTVLPTLARYARNGDPHALLMAAVLMRHPLRRIADLADPDGYHASDRDARDNDTLTIFFTLIRTTAEPHILTARYLYNATLNKVLAARPRTGTPAAATRVDPHAAILDRTDHGTTTDRTAHLLAQARDHRIITALEYRTLATLYLNADIYNPTAAAHALGANTGAVERRAQRAIRKLCTHFETAATAA